MENKNITIKDIAEMAGVAKSTVSRYLNGGRISESTSEKIKVIIEKYNYEPNAFAQSLKAKKTKFVGIIAPCLDSAVTSKTIMAMDEELRNRGYNSLILNTSLNRDIEVDNIENLSRLKVDGIILIATEITQRHKEAIKKLNVPIIIVGQKYDSAISIINDDYNAGYTVGKYILNKGHKNVLYLGVEEDDEAVGIFRKKGVLEALKDNLDVKVSTNITDFTSKKAEETIDNLIGDIEATAIICATDKIALGALKSINKHNKRVPEDISLVGFGGYDILRYINPSLTTIKFDNIEAGRLSADTIINLIEEKEVEKLKIIGFELIEGTSVRSINKLI
ncbi:LacI family DNA-binding transcriptional regulator [Clostridium nigeriense]|uniref:LacI family DNA-binding transcriptional regulator n=1 Tax=Clostridium nigeriense TaxID=1805470 RepID=UPI000831B600|nr:LacI family DNA-binding transcriptional regulator [Clostridium nigeriense]